MIMNNSPYKESQTLGGGNFNV